MSGCGSVFVGMLTLGGATGCTFGGGGGCAIRPMCCTALSTHRSTYSTHCSMRLHNPREAYTWISHASDSVAPEGIAGRRKTTRWP